MTLLKSQLHDAMAYMEALESDKMNLRSEPEWGGGMRLWLPNVIPLSPDFPGESPVAWLVANDFGGYDLSTEDPSPAVKEDDHGGTV